MLCKRIKLSSFMEPPDELDSLANIEIVRASLGDLSKIIASLKNRTIDYLEERATGAFTNRFSRRDLVDIARQLPPIEQWNENEFDARKVELKSKFQISGTQFSKAVGVIKQNREMKALLGVETP